MKPSAAAWLGMLLWALSGCASNSRLHVEPARLQKDLWLPSVGKGALPKEGFAGKVVLVTFTATWCFPCVTELPSFQHLHDAHAAEGLVVLAVGMDLEGARVLEPFAQFQELRFPLLLADERIRKGESMFGPIGALPSTFLFDRDGRVVAAYQGTAAPQGLEALVKRALAKSAD